MFLPKSMFLYKLTENPYLKPLRSELDHHIDSFYGSRLTQNRSQKNLASAINSSFARNRNASEAVSQLKNIRQIHSTFESAKKAGRDVGLEEELSVENPMELSPTSDVNKVHEVVLPRESVENTPGGEAAHMPSSMRPILVQR